MTLISERLGRSYKAVSHMLARQAPQLIRRRKPGQKTPSNRPRSAPCSPPGLNKEGTDRQLAAERLPPGGIYRRIPEGLQLTAREREQAYDPAPLPAGHPLTQRRVRLSRFLTAATLAGSSNTASADLRPE
ncbi:hypothetical protein E3E11_03355 [Oecophyllibacter saccharovorans]|uniref:hypothetical protein n=1 Tax=Oecophyllibacter saccharovorans TaxID=2558360 RepID=UPI0011423314|nr:hypothetical protein [Oecophyllibacter saccharovorans]QDH15064.1 hypothetical protein E3E11_03355 [Oecophyllibacter saccharovorans]